MNRSRVSTLEFLPLHCNKANDSYIPINGNYISGLIAGDGSIGIYPSSLTFNNKSFCSIYLAITQHKKDINLMNEIKYFFNVNNKIKIQSNNTQILIENKEFFRSVLIPFFNEYPLYGIKLNNLNKIINILSVINKYNINKNNPYTQEIKQEIINIWFTKI